MQKPISDMHGDIAFFTQPNIHSSAGRAFTRQREKMFERYNRGFEEYRKSEYFADRAATARGTASQAQFDDPAYLDRRIKECKKEIRGREKSIIKYEQLLNAIENGEERKNYDGTNITVEAVNSVLERELELVEKAMDKQGYLENCLDKLGGLRFGKDNIKPGYIVKVQRWGQVEVANTGPVNFVFRILSGGAAGSQLQAAYAEIVEIIKAAERKHAPHPFTAGEQFKAINREYLRAGTMCSVPKEILYVIIKASDTTIQLKPVGTDEKPIIRKPVKTYGGKWRFSIDDTYGNTFYKDVTGDVQNERQAHQ